MESVNLELSGDFIGVHVGTSLVRHILIDSFACTEPLMAATSCRSIRAVVKTGDKKGSNELWTPDDHGYGACEEVQ